MKRKTVTITAIVLSLLMILPYSGCSNKKSDDGKIKIACTIFPQYDWVRNIVGDTEKIELILINKSGTDMHSYQATAADIANISSCDLLIYVGGESDKWVGDSLKNAVNKDMKTLNLIGILGDRAKEEELAEGMQGDEAESDHGHENETEYDEHIWLSVKNAAFLCEKIAAGIAELDSENRNKYIENAEKYIASLISLDDGYSAAVSGASRRTVLFADRFPFRYLTDDYGIGYYAAFPGCSAETEASFETISFLAGITDRESLPYVLVLENSDTRIAQTVINASESKSAGILVMNSLQSVTEKDIAAGVTYISVMTANLETLKTALN